MSCHSSRCRSIVARSRELAAKTKTMKRRTQPPSILTNCGEFKGGYHIFQARNGKRWFGNAHGHLWHQYSRFRGIERSGLLCGTHAPEHTKMPVMRVGTRDIPRTICSSNNLLTLLYNTIWNWCSCYILSSYIRWSKVAIRAKTSQPLSKVRAGDPIST